MRKFKHKLTGDVATIKSNNSAFYTYDGMDIHARIIENSNDWEEVLVENTFSRDVFEQPKEEPNYLITAFRDSLKKIYKIDSFGNFRLGDSIFSFNQMIATSDIYSCKNNIGDEFTIGDKAKFENIDRLDDITINNFFMDKGRIIVRSTKENCGVTREINRVFKAKEPLYTTTDGFEVYEGEADRLFFLLNKDLSFPFYDQKALYIFSTKEKEVCDRFLTFTSEENRDKYIKENTKKPVLVAADGVEYYFDNGPSVLYSVNKKDWTEFSLSVGDTIRCDDKINFIHFGKYTARQEYIDFNKPKFSLKEIESCYPSPTNSPLFTTFIANLKKLGK